MRFSSISLKVDRPSDYIGQKKFNEIPKNISCIGDHGRNDNKAVA
jgi:hypothetical protein